MSDTSRTPEPPSHVASIVIGYQIVDLGGRPVHGAPNAPFKLAENDILSGLAASKAAAWCAESGNFRLTPIISTAS